MRVEIYSKADCSLCDEAKVVLEQVRKRLPFDLVEVDIERDPSLLERYRYDIPVVFIGGKKAFKHHLTAHDVEKRIRRELGMSVAQSQGPEE